MPFDSPNYRMADRLAGGRLDAILVECRAEGLSYSQVSSKLAGLGIEVSPPTAGVWMAAASESSEAVG